MSIENKDKKNVFKCVYIICYQSSQQAIVGFIQFPSQILQQIEKVVKNDYSQTSSYSNKFWIFSEEKNENDSNFEDNILLFNITMSNSYKIKDVNLTAISEIPISRHIKYVKKDLSNFFDMDINRNTRYYEQIPSLGKDLIVNVLNEVEWSELKNFCQIHFLMIDLFNNNIKGFILSDIISSLNLEEEIKQWDKSKLNKKNFYLYIKNQLQLPKQVRYQKNIKIWYIVILRLIEIMY